MCVPCGFALCDISEEPGAPDIVEVVQHMKMSGDIDEMAGEEYNALELDLFSEGRMGAQEDLTQPESDTVLKYCIVVSLVLHFAFLAWLTRIADLTPTKALLKPGEKVTSVRLVEPQKPQKEPEPPPKHASAISDRDHTAKKQRIPKRPPTPKPPLGKMERPRQRLAALSPPRVPEDLIKPETRNKPKKQVNRSEESKTERPEKKPLTQRQAKKKDLRRSPIDLRPTPQEVAQGLSYYGGTSEFYPDGDPDEVVVDLDTQAGGRFFSYLLHLKRKIQGVWVYPNSAARSGIGGHLTVEFGVNKDGRLLYANLLDSSGHTVLDQSALRAIRTAAPYLPFPPRMKAKRLRIRANFIYVTGNLFGRIM